MLMVILLGAPGSGKGTIASRLAASDSRYRHVSSGDLLRDAVKRQTPAGLEADGYMRRGELAPDGLIARMVGDLLGEAGASRVLLLDGFPRTVRQAVMLDETAMACGATLGSVILFEVGDEELVERIAGRRGCPACGAGYHVANLPPRQAGICDRCGGALAIRKDDAPETVRNRLAVYREQTMPLISFYEQRGLLKRVEGVGEIPEILERVQRALA